MRQAVALVVLGLVFLSGAARAQSGPNVTGTYYWFSKSEGSVRGTAFTLYGDPVSHVSIASVKRGVVEVDPVAPTLSTVRVRVGKEVLVGARSMLCISGIGGPELCGASTLRAHARSSSTGFGPRAQPAT